MITSGLEPRSGDPQAAQPWHHRPPSGPTNEPPTPAPAPAPPAHTPLGLWLAADISQGDDCRGESWPLCEQGQTAARGGGRNCRLVPYRRQAACSQAGSTPPNSKALLSQGPHECQTPPGQPGRADGPAHFSEWKTEARAQGCNGPRANHSRSQDEDPALPRSKAWVSPPTRC